MNSTSENNTPEALQQPEDNLPSTKLSELPQTLQDAAARAGWPELMPVQSMAIPYVLKGRDIMVQSRTGSGKTGAFVLPLLERVNTDLPACQALILVPTRELARQVAQEAEVLAHNSGVRTAAVYGGVGYGAQLDALAAGAHIVVGTPGRILDHLLRKSLVLDDLRVLVFDEADRMLSVGFYPDIKAMEVYLPKKRDGFMFSATYPPRVTSLAKQFLNEPEMLSLSSGEVHVAHIEHVAYEVPAMEKDRYLIRLIELENPDSAIIFCNTKDRVRFVSIVLQRSGYDADQLSADLTQKQREEVLRRVYQKKLKFLVATDVAARGIDVENLSHVFLYDFPEDPESYVHRAGRTGRAGAGGEAISLIDPIEVLALKAVVRQYNIEMVFATPPTKEDVAKVVAERTTALLEAKLRNLDNLVRERSGRMMSLAKRLNESEEERAVLAMLLDDYYQKSLHEPSEQEIVASPVSSAPEESSSQDHGRRRRRSRGKGRGRR